MSEKILVVDDEPMVRAVIARYLRREGYAVSEAADGPSAVEATRREQPDLLILDLMLPELDGLEVCRPSGGLAHPGCDADGQGRGKR